MGAREIPSAGIRAHTTGASARSRDPGPTSRASLQRRHGVATPRPRDLSLSEQPTTGLIQFPYDSDR
jgi:hypothetical protein